MYKNKYKFLIIVASFLIYTLYYLHNAGNVSAADISLGVYPPVIQINAQAPTNIKSPLTISNPSDQPLHIKILVRPFTAAENENGQPVYLANNQYEGSDPQIFQKMAIFDGEKNTNDIDLAPHQKKNIELRIDLPQGEPPSDYYFSLTFLSNPVSTGGASGTAVAGGISTNVLLSIGPKDKTTGNLADFSAPFFLTHGPVPFSILVTNTSKHFITPQGTILVKNIFGQTIGKINLLSVNILADSSRFLPSALNSDTKAIWKENFLLGPYAATVTVALSDQGPLYRRTIYFFAMPIQITIALIFAIILITIIVYRVKKRLA